MVVAFLTSGICSSSDANSYASADSISSIRRSLISMPALFTMASMPLLKKLNIMKLNIIVIAEIVIHTVSPILCLKLFRKPCIARRRCTLFFVSLSGKRSLPKRWSPKPLRNARTGGYFFTMFALAKAIKTTKIIMPPAVRSIGDKAILLYIRCPDIISLMRKSTGESSKQPPIPRSIPTAEIIRYSITFKFIFFFFYFCIPPQKVRCLTC